MEQRSANQIKKHIKISPYKWDLGKLKKLARAINTADVEAGKNKDSDYSDDRMAKKVSRSQACPA